MYKNFTEIERCVLGLGLKKKIVLACAHDEGTLSAIVNARSKGVIEAILIGRADKITSLLIGMGEDPADYEIMDNIEEQPCAAQAVALVRAGKADIPMKGLIHTAAFMRPILDKENGLVPPGALLSQSTVVEYRRQGRLIIISDGAVNIAPDLNNKKKIIGNTVLLAKKLGCETPRVACIAPVELENPKIISTVDAAELRRANQNGELPNCIVDGPFALDIALNSEAAMNKGVRSPVAGVAEVLLMPDLNTGNTLNKALTYFSDIPSAGTLNGTASPVIMTSRTESADNKYNSILLAILLQSL